MCLIHDSGIYRAEKWYDCLIWYDKESKFATEPLCQTHNNLSVLYKKNIITISVDQINWNF